MWKDEILEEIHKHREEYAKSFNYDLHAIVEDLRKKQALCGKKLFPNPLNNLKSP